MYRDTALHYTISTDNSETSIIVLEVVVEGILGVYDGTNSYRYLVLRAIHNIQTLIKKGPIGPFSAGYEFQPPLYLEVGLIQSQLLPIGTDLGFNCWGQCHIIQIICGFVTVVERPIKEC